MADEKQNDESAPDPWADLLAGGPSEPAPDFSFSMDDPAEDAALAAAAPTEPDPFAEGQLDDGLAASWLDEAESAPAGDPAAAAENLESDPPGSSSIEIGTGGSGIDAAGDVDAWDDVGTFEEQPSGEASTSGDTFSFDEASGTSAAEEPLPFATEVDDQAGAFAGVETATGAAPGAVVATTKVPARTRTGAKPSKAKKGGIGQMVGVVLGGVMAIPITLGILIWGFQKDPFKVAKHVPESVAFLLPQKFQPGFKKGGGGGGTEKGSPLDALGTVATPAVHESVPEESAAPEPATAGVEDVASVPLDEPEMKEPGAPAVDDVAVVPPSDGETFEDPLAPAAEPDEKPAAAAPVDEKLAAAQAAAADRRQLDAAVAEALTAIAALEEVADAEDPARKRLLVDLYKALATVGAELVMLERISADAGRPLAESPLSIADLHGRLERHQEDLVRLGRNWLGFTKRPSDGVILPVTYQSSRKVGPYWSSKVTLALAKEGVRDLVVLSRAEPAAVAGDVVVLTGMVFDGDVIWAADVRRLSPADGGGF